MFDFVKIKVCISVAIKWLNCSYLNFNTQVSTSTGAITSKQRIAEFKGLIFTISYKEITQKTVIDLEVKGSLHAYYNNIKGNNEGNSNDYTLQQVIETINDIEKRFFITENSTLHNLEPVVNVLSSVTAKEVINNVVAFKNLEVEKMGNVGVQIVASEWRFKIYDKGKQAGVKGVKNLLRIEMHYNKMRTLSPIYGKYNIVTLSDLKDITKVKPLINELLNKWDSLIYYDNSINIKHLSVRAQKRVLFYQIPKKWREFNRMQRTRAKKRFSELMEVYGSTIQKDISVLIAEKWDYLLKKDIRLNTNKSREQTADKCIRFHGCNIKTNSKINSTKMYTFSHVYCVCENVTKHPLNNTINKTPKSHQKAIVKKRICKSCENDISHKRVSAKYCSKKCNNKANGIIRTMKNRKRIVQEKQDLIRLLKILPKNKMWLMISYKTDSGIYTDTLKQSEIKTSKDWIKSVQKVLVTEHRKNAPPIILNSYRARKLLSEINTRNGI